MARGREYFAIGALASLLFVPGGWAQAPPEPSQGQRVASHLGQSLASLQTAVAALAPEQLHLPKQEKQAISDGQASLLQNLTRAMPALLAAFADAPTNLGAAFRLYRDGEAVLAVAQRSANVLPARDDDAGAELRSSTAALDSSLDALGAWIESQGSADFAARQPAHATAAAGPAAAPAPPATLVIQDANQKAKPGAKKPAAKKTTPRTPHN